MTMLRVAAAVLAVSVEAATAPPVIWHVAGEARGTPAADESTVYFVSKYHELVAFDVATGRQRWRAHTHETDPETFGFGAVVAGSVVAVGDYDVIAFDRESGEFRWKFEPADGHAPGVYLGAAAAGVILTGSPSGRLYAVNQETGKCRWSVVVADDGHTTVFEPVAKAGLAIAGFTDFVVPHRGGLIAVEIDTGMVRWKAFFPAPVDPSLATNWAGGPVFVDDLVLATSGDGTISAFALENGAIRWSLPRVDNLPPRNIISPERDFRPLAISGSTLVSGSLTSVVIGYDLQTKRERWRFVGGLSGSTVFKITAAEQTVYVPYFSGELVALNVEDGTERWRIGDWKAGFIWASLVSNGRVFAGGSGAGYYAFSADAALNAARGSRWLRRW